MNDKNRSAQGSGQETTPQPKTRRPWILNAVIAILVGIVTVQAGIIWLSRSSTVRQVASTYSDMTSPEYLTELNDLLQDLNASPEALGLPPVTVPQKGKPNAPAPPQDPSSNSNRGNGAPRSQTPQDDPLGLNSELDTDSLLDSLQALSSAYNQLFRMLEDDAIIPQSHQRLPRSIKPNPAPSGLEPLITSSESGYRIEIPMGAIDTFEVECVDRSIVVRGQRHAGSGPKPFVHEVELDGPVVCGSMQVTLEGETIVISADKVTSQGAPNPTPTALT